MTREIINQLIRQAMTEGTPIIVLVMPKEGSPVIATSIKDSPEVMVEILRGWARMLENAHRAGTLIRHAHTSEVVLQA